MIVFSSFAKSLDYYYCHEDQLLTDHLRKWILIVDGQFIGAFESSSEAHTRAGDVDHFVRYITNDHHKNHEFG